MNISCILALHVDFEARHKEKQCEKENISCSLCVCEREGEHMLDSAIPQCLFKVTFTFFSLVLQDVIWAQCYYMAAEYGCQSCFRVQNTPIFNRVCSKTRIYKHLESVKLQVI